MKTYSRGGMTYMRRSAILIVGDGHVMLVDAPVCIRLLG